MKTQITTSETKTKRERVSVAANYWKQIALVCVIGTLLGSSAAEAIKSNCFSAAPAEGGETFTYIIQGDVTNKLSASMTEANPLVDPFTYVNKIILKDPGGTSSVQISLVNGNTQVVFTGSNEIEPWYQFPETGNKGPHFGLEPKDGGPANLNIISEQWNNLASSSTISVEPPKPGAKYELVYALSTDTSSGAATGAWFEVPFQPSGHKFTFQNNGLDTVKLSDVGYFVTSTDYTLDQLNSILLPTPGTAGSPFAQLPQYDGQSVSPGGSLDVVTPEPSTLALLGSGLVGLSAFLRKRRNQAD